MPPVIALAEPDEFLGLRQEMPVDAPVAALEESRHLLFEHVAHRAGSGVGDAQHFLFMVARRGHEREFGAVLIPLHVGPFAAAARHVVAQRGPVLVRRQLQSHHARAIQIDRHALDRGDHIVARQRVLPRLQRRVPHLGFHQVHFAHAALILLERRDPLGIGRPQYHRPVAAGPTGVVRRVAEVLDAVGGERRLFISRRIAHPQIEIAYESRVLLVGGENLGNGAAAAASTPAPSAAPARTPRAFFRGALRALHVALPSPAGLHRNRLPVGRELDLLEREIARAVSAPGGSGERGRKLRVVEGGRPRALHRIHQDEFSPLRRGDAIPEALVGQPVRAHAGAQHQWRGVVAHQFLGARVVGGRELLLGGNGSDGEQARRETGTLFHLGRMITFGRGGSQEAAVSTHIPAAVDVQRLSRNVAIARQHHGGIRHFAARAETPDGNPVGRRVQI